MDGPDYSSPRPVVCTHFYISFCSAVSVLTLFGAVSSEISSTYRKYPVRHCSDILFNIYFHFLQGSFFSDGNDFTNDFIILVQ